MTAVSSFFIVFIICVLFLVVLTSPSIIAWKTKHDNRFLIYMANFILLLIPLDLLSPMSGLNFILWLILLLYSAYNRPKYKVVQGPKGDPGKDGEPGKDAIPMSKAGNIQQSS